MDRHGFGRLPDYARDRSPLVDTNRFSPAPSITPEPRVSKSSTAVRGYLSPKSLSQPRDRDPASTPLVLQEAPTALSSGTSSIFARVRPTERPPQDLEGTVTSLRRTTHLDPIDPTDVWEGIWTSPNNEQVRVSIRPLGSDLFGADDEDRLKRVLRRLEREAMVWAAVPHDNIVPLFGYFQGVNKAPQLVYPFFENGTLGSYVNNHRGLTYIERLKLSLNLARGLGQLHSREPAIVYGNLKPANVMVDDDMNCVLLDFSNSRVTMAPGIHSDFNTDSTRGTVVYLAKELLLENALPTLASDVYALGGLILFIMTGKAPFHAIRGGVGSIIFIIMRGETPIPSDYPALAQDDPLWSLMKKCWDPQPDRRPSMSQIIYKLNLILTCGSGLTGPIHSDTLDTPVVSVVQPGVHITFLPPELPGILVECECIGEGGYGIVHRGTWTAPSKEPVPVAIKRIKQIQGSEYNEEQKRAIWAVRIKRETVIWKAAEHPNVLALYGYKIIDEQPSLISPWCENGNLWSYLRKHPELTDIQKLEILIGVARGLGHLHSLKPPICHGDIKPQNVVVGDKKEALLCDFGISRVMTHLVGTGMTTTGGVTGTHGYLAKELSEEDSKPTDKSDVYAFGGLILATMTGKPPFYKNLHNAFAIVVLVYQGKTPVPADYPELPETHNLWDLMRKCWDPVPNNRPSMAQIAAELEVEITR